MKPLLSVHQSILRIESQEKVTGKTRYAEDFKLHNEAVGEILYPRHPRALIASLDTSEAEALPGVLKVVTAADVPGSNCLFGRFPVLADKEVKYIGDALACVAAETRDIARRALELISVEYEERPGIFTMDDLKDESIPPVHPDRPDNTMENTLYHQYAGNIEEGLKESDLESEAVYETPFAVNGYIEPDCVVAARDPITGGIAVYGCIQNVYSIRGAVCSALDLPSSKVRVVQTAIGGSFGGKNETSVSLATKAALLASLTDRPVRLRMSRKEIFYSGVKRHPYHFEIQAGMTASGEIRSWKNTVTVLGGPYNNQAMFADWRAAVHSAGPYRTPHVKTDIQTYYTHTPYAGAYRGFSAPQMCFAVESMIDELAAKAGIDPAAFRKRNFVRPGDTITCGQTVDPGVMVLPLEAMMDDVLLRGRYEEKKREFGEFNRSNKRLKKGLGLAATYRGCGLGGEGFDVAGAVITVEKDGHILVHSDMVDMGQGLRTAHAQVAAETLGVPLRRIALAETDTSALLDAGPTVASRGLTSGGMAVKNAAEILRQRMTAGMAASWEVPEEQVVLADDRFSCALSDQSCSFAEAASRLINDCGMSLSAQGWHNPGVVHIDPETGKGNCYPSYLTGVSLTEVQADLYTGKITVPRVTMAYEVGRAVNPGIVRGQIVGGYTQGLGYALTENFITEEGLIKTGSFGSYHLPLMGDVPEFDLNIFEEDFHTGPYGAKGVGEIGVELAAPGVANAVFNATGVRVRQLPLNRTKMAALFYKERLL